MMIEHPGFVLWFTGLSGAGKTTLAKALQEKLTKGFSKAKSKIEPRCQELVIDGLKKEPAYSSILAGKLKTDFGLTDEIAAGFL
ncbi:MAG: adenylyl-sulfate kinase, partial [Aggregatilineales bacterium]